MQYSTVQVLYDNGFSLGPGPDVIHGCGCRWGDHVLMASGAPLDGGRIACPYCPCIGTWATPPGEETKARYRSRY
jgi:hypothetical protein